MAVVEYSGFEIEPYENDGFWYARVRKTGDKELITGAWRALLLEMPSDTEDGAVEVARGLINSGEISA
jgi:hypothetical protein